MTNFSLKFYSPYTSYNLKGTAETLDEAAQIIKAHLEEHELDMLPSSDFKEVKFGTQHIPSNKL